MLKCLTGFFWGEGLGAGSALGFNSNPGDDCVSFPLADVSPHSLLRLANLKIIVTQKIKEEEN